MPICRYHEGRINDAQLCEIMRLYGDALGAYRAGNFNSADIPPPSIMALDDEGWQTHLEMFIQGIAAPERHRERGRAKKVSAAETPQETKVSAAEMAVSAAETPQSKVNINRSEVKRNVSEAKRNEDNAHECAGAGAAACGKDAAAFPVATTPAKQPTETDSGALGTDTAQVAFDGLTHTDTQQKRADDAAASIKARETAQGLRTRFGISADAPPFKSLVASMKNAARRMGWSGVVECLNGCREELDCWESSRGEDCFKFIADRMEGAQ